MLFTDLETKRLYLKKVDEEDRLFLYQLFSNREVSKYIFDIELMQKITDVDKLLNVYIEPEPRNHQRWIITQILDNAKIGGCSLTNWDKANGTVDISYLMLEEFRGFGYMQEVAEEVIKFAMERLNVIEINTEIFIENERSIKLAEKLGFILTDKKMLKRDRKEYPHYVYTLKNH